MRGQSFHEVCRWAFRGWDKVETYIDADLDVTHVRLTLNNDSFVTEGMDINELGNRLLSGTNAWKLVEMASQQKSRLGLRRYGKRRR